MTAVDVAHAPAPAPSGATRAAAPSYARQPTLRGYARFVRHHWALIAFFALLGTTVGGLLVANSPAEFVAKATVAVTAQPTGGDIDTDRPRLVSLDSDAQILSSGAVLGRAAQNAAYPGGGSALKEHLDVSALPNSRVLIIRVTDADRALALRACGAVIDEFLRTRAATESARGIAESDALSTEITDVLDRLAALRAADDESGDATPTDPSVTTPATGPAADLLTRLAELENELRLVSSSGTASPGTIVLPPTAPGAGGRPMAGATVVSGLLIGALLGVTVAALRGGRVGHVRRLHVPLPASRRADQPKVSQ